MDAKNALQAKSAAKPAESRSIKDWITVMEPEIKKALPSVITPERFTRMALSAVSGNPALGDCTPKSFIAALMNAAQLGLEPNTPLGQAYLIPYRNNAKGITEAQFQIGYKGLIDLAFRSGQFKVLYAKEVYENDEFEYEFGLDPKLVHKPAAENRGKVTHYYGVFTLINGGFGFEVMSIADVQQHRSRYSKAKNSPWNDNFDEMAKKTLIKKVLKYAPIRTEFVRQMAQDETIKNEIDVDMSMIEADYVIDQGDEVQEASGEE